MDSTAQPACRECGRMRYLRVGLCGACYERAWRAAHPEEQKARRDKAYAKKSIKLGRYPRGESLEVRLLRRVICDIATRCWLWQAAKDPKGYGRMGVEVAPKVMRMATVHRVSYQLYRGPIPDGLQIDHLCRVRHCVNPDHLEVVTPYENYLRGNRGATGPAPRPRPRNVKTHCKHGHLYDEENTYWSKGTRICKRCHSDNHRRRKATLASAS